jgi:hypothetical protein
MINEIFKAKLIQITQDGNYWVQRVGTDPAYAPAFAQMKAQMLTPFPNTDGTQEYRIPNSLINAFCVCIRVDRDVYITGFLPAVSSKELVKGQPGEFLSQHSSGTFTQITSQGKYIIFTDLFAALSLDPISQTYYSQFKNVIQRLWAGYLTVQVDDNDFQLLTVYLARKLDTSELPDSTVSPQDNIVLQIGNIANQTHLVDFVLSQNYSGKTAPPSLTLHTTIGENSNNTPQSVVSVETSNSDASTNSQLILGTKAELKWVAKGGNTITLLLDPNADETIKFNVNDKGTVAINSDGSINILSGNVTIDGGTVNLKTVIPGSTNGFAYPICFMTGAPHSAPNAGQQT